MDGAMNRQDLLMILVFVLAALALVPLCRSKSQTGRCRNLSHEARRKERAILGLKALIVVGILLAACGALGVVPRLP